MKQIKTKSGNILCVEVPEDAYDFTIYENGVYFKPTIIQYTIYGEINPHPSVNFRTYNLKLKIINKLSELTDKDCEEFVLQYGEGGLKDVVNSIALGFSEIIKVSADGLGYRNYLDNLNNNYTLKPKESFISLLQSEGIDTNKEWLIIKVL